jgi:RES domain-containing protein
MKVFRIVQDKRRTSDLSGIGAFRSGGRWNSKGTYMLYCSENSSLAFLESLVHFDKILIPPQLFISELEITGDSLTGEGLSKELDESFFNRKSTTGRPMDE